MTEADVERLCAEKKIRAVTPDPETARAELDVARRHIASAEKIMADDSTLAFTALYDAMRKAIAAHMRSRGYRVTRGPGAHAKTGEYALAALDHLDIGSHLDEFDALRDLRLSIGRNPPFWLNGAAQESNLPSDGLRRLTGFEGLLRRVHLRTEAGFRPRFSPLRYG